MRCAIQYHFSCMKYLWGFISVKFSDSVLSVCFCLNAKNEMNNIHYRQKCEGLTGRTLGDFYIAWMCDRLVFV